MDLATYLLVALMTWTGKPAETLQPWSDAMAAVCDSKEECTLLAAQAFVESRFEPWVIDQSCNHREWRETHRGWLKKACDGGNAVGVWQIHDVRLLGASPQEQAAEAVDWLRKRPHAWTTWRAARSHAAWWLSGH